MYHLRRLFIPEEVRPPMLPLYFDVRLPQEMESLGNLQSLYMNNNVLLKKPSFLQRMTKLEQMNLENNPFCDT